MAPKKKTRKQKTPYWKKARYSEVRESGEEAPTRTMIPSEPRKRKKKVTK